MHWNGKNKNKIYQNYECKIWRSSVKYLHTSFIYNSLNHFPTLSWFWKTFVAFFAWIILRWVRVNRIQFLFIYTLFYSVFFRSISSESLSLFFTSYTHIWEIVCNPIFPHSLLGDKIIVMGQMSKSRNKYIHFKDKEMKCVR